MISYDDIKSGRAAAPAPAAAEVRDHDLDLSEIKLDQSAQPREALNNDRIAEYAEAMKAGDQFPPLTVFHDGSTYWLADGFHRHYAAQHAGRKHIRCHVRQGGLRDAILWSVGANAKHGLPRSDEDNKRAVMRLLDDAEWSQWSDREIARRCRVSDKTVAKYRPVASADRPQIERKVQRGGTVYTQKVAKAAKSNAREALVNDEPFPEVGPQAEAFQSQGTGAGTLADREGRYEGEAASVDLPTIPRSIVAEVRELWNLATPSERDEIRAFTNFPAPEQKTAGHAPRDMGSDGANAGGNDVDGSAKRAGHAGQPFDALSGQVETRNSDNFVERTTSGPDAKRAQIFQSDGDAISGVKGSARLENAAGVESSPSDNASAAPAEAATENDAIRQPVAATNSNPQAVSSRQADKAEASTSSPGASATIHSPATLAAADGQPSIPTSDALAAGHGGEPRHNAKSEEAVVQFTNPRCQKPETCKWVNSQASCAACNQAWMNARAA